jgi:hypothetical protein
MRPQHSDRIRAKGRSQEQEQGAREGRQARAGLHKERVLVSGGALWAARGGEQKRRQCGHKSGEIPVRVQVEAVPVPSFLRKQHRTLFE